jgi:hypothetical protein
MPNGQKQKHATSLLLPERMTHRRLLFTLLLAVMVQPRPPVSRHSAYFVRLFSRVISPRAVIFIFILNFVVWTFLVARWRCLAFLLSLGALVGLSLVQSFSSLGFLFH